MPTTRSRPQIIFRHLPGSLFYDDEQGVQGLVKDVTGKLDSSIDLNRLADRIRQWIDAWKEQSEGEPGKVSPDVDYLQPTDIQVVYPEFVGWELFPYYFRCTRNDCGIWQYRRDVEENQGRCVRCERASLQQTPYVWVHHCGYIVPLVPGGAAHCPRHGEKLLYLHDTGTFSTSSWRCRGCGHQATFGFMNCRQCGMGDPRPQPMRWDDPGTYSSVTMQIINLREERRQRLLAAENRDSALQAVFTRVIEAGQDSIVVMAEASDRVCPGCGSEVSNSAHFCAECGSRLQIPEGTDQVPSSVPGEALDDMVTYALLWDLPGSKSLASTKMWNSGSHYHASDILYLERFPVSLVGLGYRRQLSKPPATLRLFDATISSKSIRVFTNSADVEAWAIRLDPASVWNWLVSNDVGIDAKRPEGECEMLSALQVQMSLSESVHTAVTGVLHSVSHAAIIGLSWCSGMDLPSFSEELLPRALTTVVHAGDTSLGGLSSVFEQTPWQPLEMASGDLVACQLDPACTEDDGGACIACLHLPRGCTMWNTNISRAYLFGGRSKDLDVIEHGFWQ